MKKIIILVLTLMLCLSAVACVGDGSSDDVDSIQNIAANSSVLASYESTVRITSIEPTVGSGRAEFKSSISVNDITLSEALAGKSVKSVKYIDKYNIEVVLAGKAQAFEGDFGDGILTVSHKALENDDDAFATVVVEKAKISTVVESSVSASGTYSATYKLNAGSFNAEYANKDNVKLSASSDGTLEVVKIENGMLTVVVMGASNCPEIVIGANVTSFNKEIKIRVDSAEYILE